MGQCSSAPRLKVNLRNLMATNPPPEGSGDDWYLDTMNVLLDRWAHSHVQLLKKKFLEATGGGGEKELDKQGFFKLFAELQDMPNSVAESAFRMFDTDNSGKLNFREFCCALALCCHLMSSDDEKIRFVFDMFDTNDDGLLTASDLQLLLEHAVSREEGRVDDQDEAQAARKSQQVLDMQQEILGSAQQLSFDRFYEWATRNLDSLNNLLCTFQIVPSPERERTVCEEILARNQTLQEGSRWYCVSHKWLQVWKAHTGWTGPVPGRRVTGQGVLASHWSYTAPTYLPHNSQRNALGAAPPQEELETMSVMSEMQGAHQSVRPPEIDNSDIEGEHKGELKMNLVEHLDFELLPEEMWLRLQEWYGGGPAIPRNVIACGPGRAPQIELYPPLVLVVAAGESGQPLPQFSKRFFISRQSSIAEVLQMLAEKLSRPWEKSRLWHRAKGEQWWLVEDMAITLDEFLEGKVSDAGAFLLETQSSEGAWPRDSLSPDSEAGDRVAGLVSERELNKQFQVGDRVEAQSAVSNQWMKSTIVDVVQNPLSGAPSQVKVHYDSTVYKCDEWISTFSNRLAALNTHTARDKSVIESEKPLTGPIFKGATGLNNLGNTCFLNATVQCLANSPLVKEYFLTAQCSKDLAEKGSSFKAPLATEFGQVLRQLWAGTSSFVAPSSLKRTIDQLGPQFSGYEQHDAQELLAFLLDGLHEDLNRSTVSGNLTSSGRLALTLRRDGTPKLFSGTPTRPGTVRHLGTREMWSPTRPKPVWKKGDSSSSQALPRSSSKSFPDEAASAAEASHSSHALPGPASSPSASPSCARPRGSGGMDGAAEEMQVRSREAVAAEGAVAEEGSVSGTLGVSLQPWPPPSQGDRSDQEMHDSMLGEGAVKASLSGSRGIFALGQDPGTAPQQSPSGRFPSERESLANRIPPGAPRSGSGSANVERNDRPAPVLREPLEVAEAAQGSPGGSPGSSPGAAVQKAEMLLKDNGSSRWWNFAWRRGWGALDLPTEQPAESAPNEVLAKDVQPTTPTSHAAQQAAQQASEQVASVSHRPGSPSQDNQRASPVVSSPSRDGDARPKMPLGAAGAAVAAAAAARVAEDSASAPAQNESEDFVPELLGPSQELQAKRSLGLSFWRWRKPDEEMHGPHGASPRRRAQTPEAMEPLQEEQPEDMAVTFQPSGGHRQFSGGYRQENGDTSMSPAGALTGPRSFLPWRGKRVGQDPLNSKLKAAVPGPLKQSEEEETPPQQPKAASLGFSLLRPWTATPRKEESPAPQSEPGARFRSEESMKEGAGELLRAHPAGERSQEASPDVRRGGTEEDASEATEQEEEKVDEENLPDEEKAALHWERYRARNRSVVVDVFEGQLRSQLICGKCGASSSTFEPFRYLSVPIPADHVDHLALKVVFFPMPHSRDRPFERQQLVRFTISVPKTSTVQKVEQAIGRRLPVPMSSVWLAEVYRGRIHRHMDSNLSLTDVSEKDQLYAFEVLQLSQELIRWQEKYCPSKNRRDSREDSHQVALGPPGSLAQPQVSVHSQSRVLLIQAMHRRVVDVCRSDGTSWSQRREVFGLPFMLSAASNWTYATLYDVLLLQANRFVKPARFGLRAGSDSSASGEERQLPFVARIVNSSGAACGACDRANCSGCLLPKGNVPLQLRAGLLMGASTAKIFLALDWVDPALYDQEFLDDVVEDDGTLPEGGGTIPEEAAAPAAAESEAKASEREPPAASSSRAEKARVSVAACIDAFAKPEDLKVELGNGVHCEKCGVLVDAVKKLEIWREPDILLVHVKRFHFTGVHFEKLNTSVEVPLQELNLRPWMVGPSSAGSPLYELYGIICHWGGMSGGHYTAFCVNNEGPEPRWLKFNDDTVTQVSLGKEQEEIFKQCYVLCYRKKELSSSNLINYLSML